MLLDSSTKSLELLLGEAHTTSAVEIAAHYEDDFQEQSDRPVELTSVSLGATAVTIIPAPSQSTARRVQEITIFNADTVSHLTTVRLKDVAEYRRCIRVTLTPGQTLMYTKEHGWFVPGSVYAPLDSPIFTGDPRASKPAAGDDDTSIPTTSWVQDFFSPTETAVTVAAGVADINSSLTVANTLTGTGNPSVTSLGSNSRKKYRLCRVLASMVFVNSANLITNTGANIQAAAGDWFIAQGETGNVWRIDMYQPFGAPVQSIVSGVSCTGGTQTSIASISVPVGRWSLSGLWSSGYTVTNTWVQMCLGTTVNSVTGTVLGSSHKFCTYDSVGGAGGDSIPTFEVILASATTYYLTIAPRTNTIGTVSGTLRAVRLT